MHVDDRLATVLAVSATGENQLRAQLRQLLDLIGTTPADARGESLDAGLLRLAELSRQIAPAERAEALTRAGVRLRNPRLVAELACDHPTVSAAAIAVAQLSEEQWLDILPALPQAARTLLMRRTPPGSKLAAQLAQLGIGAPPLPGPPAAEAAQPAARLQTNVLPLRTRVEARVEEVLSPAITASAGIDVAPREGIGAIVRRIEAFRRNRQASAPAANDAPQLPMGEEKPAPPVSAFVFACDAAGRVTWADAAIAGTVVGLMLPLADPVATHVATAVRRRVPIRATPVTLEGAPAIAGAWILDAAPEFDQNGNFTGYIGKFRRQANAGLDQAASPEAVRVRQILHELRTPVNAIQGFAEMIHQQLVGPVPHGYRALAAGIAADAAQMLAGFDELERLAKLDSAALTLDPGHCDLRTIVTGLITQLEAYTAPRGSGFRLSSAPEKLVVGITADEAERLGWRLLATLAAAAHPGEILAIDLSRNGNNLLLAITLPEALAALPDPTEAAPPAAPQAVSGGLFGTGFALRLASAEVKGAGGTLAFRAGRVWVEMPCAQSPGLASDDTLVTLSGVRA